MKVKFRAPYPNELWHYGVPGQRKGVRNYQNLDGTLTEAGRKRYMVSDDEAKSIAAKAYEGAVIGECIDCGPFYVVLFSVGEDYGWCKVSKSGGEIFRQGGSLFKNSDAESET